MKRSSILIVIGALVAFLCSVGYEYLGIRPLALYCVMLFISLSCALFLNEALDRPNS